MVLLLHDQEKRAVVAQTSRVKPGRQHVWILILGTRQQRNICGERTVNSDHIRMS